jgi:hypothetical protein
MGHFKQWFLMQELAMGSDGMRDNSPTQTAGATNQVIQTATANPQFSDEFAQLSTIGVANPSRATNLAMDLAARAIKGAPKTISGQTNAAQVAQGFSANLGLKPNVVKVNPGKVRLMRRRMRRV